MLELLKSQRDRLEIEYAAKRSLLDKLIDRCSKQVLPVVQLKDRAPRFDFGPPHPDPVSPERTKRHQGGRGREGQPARAGPRGVRQAERRVFNRGHRGRRQAAGLEDQLRPAEPAVRRRVKSVGTGRLRRYRVVKLRDALSDLPPASEKEQRYQAFRSEIKMPAKPEEE